MKFKGYNKASNISRILVGNKIVDNSWIGQRQLQGEARNIQVWGIGATYTRGFTAVPFHKIALCTPPTWFLKRRVEEESSKALLDDNNYLWFGTFFTNMA